MRRGIQKELEASTKLVARDQKQDEREMGYPNRTKNPNWTHTQKSSTSIRHPFDIEKNREESGSVMVRSAPGVKRK
jgi:hypothetical protein